MDLEQNESKKMFNKCINFLRGNIENVPFYDIVKILPPDYMDKFLIEYEKSIDSLTIEQSNVKSICAERLFKFSLSHSKLEYIQHLSHKYNQDMKPCYLYHIVKNNNQLVFEHWLSLVQFDSDDMMDVIDAIVFIDIETNKLKLLLNVINNIIDPDMYFAILKCICSYDNLENFKLVHSYCKDLLDIKSTFIAREEPLMSLLDFYDYSMPLECDLLLVSSDSNSYHIVEYLLELGLFSYQSMEKAYQYAKLNSCYVRLNSRIKFVDNKDKTISILEKYINV